DVWAYPDSAVTTMEWTSDNTAIGWEMDVTGDYQPVPMGTHVPALRQQNAISPAGTQFATAVDSIKVFTWDGITYGDQTIELSRPHARQLMAVIYSPDGRWLAATSPWRDYVEVWDT